MKHEPLFELCEDDVKLFERMKTQFQSEEERIFFETMCHKEQDEPAYSNEELILEEENEDMVYIIRCSEHEYEFGAGDAEHSTRFYVNSLSEMLSTPLQEVGVASTQGTMLDWLRARNYKGVRYDRNLALM